MTRMYGILSLLALALVAGCSSTANLPSCTKQSGDLGAFILQQSSKFGARAQQTNGLPQFTAHWLYKEESNGFEICLAGDHFAQLQSFLTAAFGPPMISPKTRELAGTKDIATHYDPEKLGSFLHYGSRTTRDGKQSTSMVVISANALK